MAEPAPIIRFLSFFSLEASVRLGMVLVDLDPEVNGSIIPSDRKGVIV